MRFWRPPQPGRRKGAKTPNRGARIAPQCKRAGSVLGLCCRALWSAYRLVDRVGRLNRCSANRVCPQLVDPDAPVRKRRALSSSLWSTWLLPLERCARILSPFSTTKTHGQSRFFLRHSNNDFALGQASPCNPIGHREGFESLRARSDALLEGRIRRGGRCSRHSCIFAFGALSFGYKARRIHTQLKNRNLE